MATNVSAPPSSAQAGDDSHIIGEEYEHTPVPPGARLSLGANITVWIGFPMIITGAITGSLLVLGMGFSKALTAMVIGNVFMFLYVGLMGQIGAHRQELCTDCIGRIWQKGLRIFIGLTCHVAPWLVRGADGHHRRTGQRWLWIQLHLHGNHCRASLYRNYGNRGAWSAHYWNDIGAALRHSRPVGAL